MANSDKTPPRQLGDEIRQLRRQSALTQSDIADRLRVHYTLIGKLERGERTPQWAHIEALDTLFETGGRLGRLWRDLTTQRTVPDWLRNTLLLERKAREIRYFQPLVVPGPLQTRAYARCLVGAGQSRMAKEEIDRIVDVRVGRLPALLASEIELISYILRESVLTDVIGSKVIMEEQLQSILELAQSGVQVQVLPTETTSGIKGFLPFQVLTLDGTRQIGVAEHHDGGTVIDDPERVSRMATQFGHLQAHALSPRESVNRIAETKEAFHALEEK